MSKVEEEWADEVTNDLPNEVEIPEGIVNVKMEPKPWFWWHLKQVLKYPYLIVRWWYRNRPARRMVTRWNQLAHGGSFSGIPSVEKVGVIGYPSPVSTYNVNSVKVWKDGKVVGKPDR